MLQGLSQRRHLLAIQLGHVGMHKRGWRVCRVSLALNSSRLAALTVSSSFTSDDGTPSVTISISFLRRGFDALDLTFRR